MVDESAKLPPVLPERKLLCGGRLGRETGFELYITGEFEYALLGKIILMLETQKEALQTGEGE